MNLNERFKEARKALKFTQKQYAEELGISQAHLSGIENGKDNPSIPLIKLVCIKYGINEDWLISEKGVMFYKDNDFDVITDDGLKTKYQITNGILDKMISEQSGEELKNIVQSYSYFVNFISTHNLKDNYKKEYLESASILFDTLENISFQSYMLKDITNHNYRSLLHYKTNVDDSLDKIKNTIKKALTCYLNQYEKEITL